MRFDPLRRLRGHRRAWLVVAALAGVLVLIGARATRHGGASGDAPFAHVARGDLDIEVASVGELDAVHSMSFGVPRLRGTAAKVVWLAPEGGMVSPGDTLAKLDPSEVLRRIEDLEGRLASARANLDKTRATHAARLAEMEAALADQKAAVRLAEIGAAGVEYEAQVEQERAQLELQRARLAVDQAQSKLEAQRTIQDAEITEQKVGIAELESQLATERSTLADHVVVAPTAGLVVYGTTWQGGRQAKVKVGDQLYYGGVVVELPDLAQMRVSSWVNEARVDLLRVGLPCEIRIDAFPDTVYHGSISRINVLGRELPDSDGVKVFDYDVRIDGSDRRLRPRMTASVVVRVATVRDVLYAPIEAVHGEGAGAWVLRRRGRGLERVPVTLGRRNDFHVILTSGVQAGDELALGAPTDRERGGE